MRSRRVRHVWSTRHGCDLLRDDVFADLMARIRAGEFFSVIIGTPCSTFSVARIPKNGVYDGGPRQLRDINRPGRGRTNLNLSDQRTLDLSNILVERSVLIARRQCAQQVAPSS